MDQKPKMFGSLTRRVVIGSVVTLVLVQVGWWASDQLPDWMQGWRIRRAATALRSPVTTIYGPAIRTLGYAQPRSLPWLAEASQDPDPQIRFRAFEAIGTPLSIPPEAAPLLIAGLDDPIPSVQSTAIVLVGQVGPDARQASNRLTQLTTHKQAYMRQIAAQALRLVNPGAEAVYRPVFLALLTDPDPTHSLDRTRYLAEIAAQGPAAVDEAIVALLAMLETAPAHESRWQALQCLAKIGPAARTAVPALTRALGDDRDPAGRCLAAQALYAVEGVDNGRVRATLRDLHDRSLLPADLDARVATLLGLGLTDGSDLPQALMLLKRADQELQYAVHLAKLPQ